MDYEEFAHWIAKQIFEGEVTDNPECFCELACRKLVKLGIVKTNGNNYELATNLQPTCNNLQPKGEWIAIEPYNHKTFCSVCHQETWEYEHHNYCSCCGADMRDT